MADFRRCFFALSLLVLVLGSVVPVSAQIGQGGALTCTFNAAVPPRLRAEGLTELAGDIVLNCQGGQPTAQGVNVAQVNVTVFLNTQVTSRLLSSAPAGSEALLMIDEPGSTLPNAPQTQALCSHSNGCVIVGNGGSSELYEGNPNIYSGTVSGNSVTFYGVPVDPPGTAGFRVLRITNVRANASAVAPGASGIPGQVIASISISGSTSVPVNNPTQIIGYVSPGLVFSTTGAPVSYAQCLAPGENGATLNFMEGFATAFKTRVSTDTDGNILGQNVPGAIYNTESGFYAPAVDANIGLADFGTRLKAIFNNIPAGLTLSVPTMLTSAAGGMATLISSEAGSYAAAASGTVALTNGSGIAIWEVTGDDPTQIETFSAWVGVAYTPDPATNNPALGNGTVAGSFAPTPTNGAFLMPAGASATTGPVPRFVDTSTALPLLSVVTCHTNLLFPFVTNQVGFDTGLAISNTSTDIFGTSAQTGPCTLYQYGSNAGSPVTTPAVASGTTWTGDASALMPNFQGYVIAQCQFQYAHGLAFISLLGAQGNGSTYLALIMPDVATRVPTDFTKANTADPGETLGF